MKRIMIIGNAGAGKSTLAGALSEKFDLPIVHLDQLYWDADWQMRDKQAFWENVQEAIKSKCWIMDGNYRSTIPNRLAVADMVIFLDFPSWLCVWRILTRTLKNHRQSRPDMPEGCLERFDWGFTKYTWHFNKNNRPTIVELLKNYEGQLITLRSPSQVKTFLKAVSA